jgi:hypothetical protein
MLARYNLTTFSLVAKIKVIDGRELNHSATLAGSLDYIIAASLSALIAIQLVTPDIPDSSRAIYCEREQLCLIQMPKSYICK